MYPVKMDWFVRDKDHEIALNILPAPFYMFKNSSAASIIESSTCKTLSPDNLPS